MFAMPLCLLSLNRLGSPRLPPERTGFPSFPVTLLGSRRLQPTRLVG
jgi:hypothetical protein